MSYTNQTTHYGIPLPTSGDLVNLLDWNQSSEDIDAAIYGAAEAAQQAGSDIQIVAGDVSQLQTDLAGTQDVVTAIDGRVTSLEQSSGTLDDKVDDIADMITPREVTSAQSNIRVNVDELFRYNDVLYKCTVQINIGDTIVPNVNCTATNVETELAAGGGSAEIDDTITSASKVWSSQKTHAEILTAHIGDVRFSNGKLQQYNGTQWVDISIGGDAMVNFANKLYHFDSTHLTYTASDDVFLFGCVGKAGDNLPSKIEFTYGGQTSEVTFKATATSPMIFNQFAEVIKAGTVIKITNGSPAMSDTALEVFALH